METTHPINPDVKGGQQSVFVDADNASRFKPEAGEIIHVLCEFDVREFNKRPDLQCNFKRDLAAA